GRVRSGLGDPAAQEGRAVGIQLTRPWSWVVGRPRLLDRLVVAFLFLLGVPPVVGDYLIGSPVSASIALVLLVPQTVPLLRRRIRPIEVLLIVATASAARLALGRPGPDNALAIAAAVYSVSVYGPARERLAVAGLAVASVVVGAGGLLITGARAPW